MVADNEAVLRDRRYLFNTNVLVGKVLPASCFSAAADVSPGNALLGPWMFAACDTFLQALIPICYVCMPWVQVRSSLKFADVALLKAAVEKQVTSLLGPMTEADIAAAAAPKQKVHFRNPLVSQLRRSLARFSSAAWADALERFVLLLDSMMAAA